MMSTLPKRKSGNTHNFSLMSEHAICNSEMHELDAFFPALALSLSNYYMDYGFMKLLVSFHIPKVISRPECHGLKFKVAGL